MADFDSEVRVELDAPMEEEPKISSLVSQPEDNSGRTFKGRGFQKRNRDSERRDSKFGSTDPQKSMEGWNIVVTGIHEECAEDDLRDQFSEFGEIKKLSLNLDRKTGYAKGYAFLEYVKKDEAQEAIDKMNGSEFLEQTLKVDWAVMKGPFQ
eukprot:GCRY01000861.1.p1 GENE.GCRY01000861.1~~GCRY01000861.1.p1  ORF type:complete len:152 (-),score=33.13 GCRY01000861.1:42-497(-)